jgi:hypothetical protein
MNEHLTAEEIEAEVYELPLAGDPALLGAHYRECAACRALRDRFQQERSLLEGAAASASMPTEFADRLAARIPVPRRPQRFQLLALAVPAWVAAAALAVLVLRLSAQVSDLTTEVRRLSFPPSSEEPSVPPAPVRKASETPSGRFVGLRGSVSPSPALDALQPKKPIHDATGLPPRMLPSLTRLVRPSTD